MKDQQSSRKANKRSKKYFKTTRDVRYVKLGPFLVGFKQLFSIFMQEIEDLSLPALDLKKTGRNGQGRLGYFWSAIQRKVGGESQLLSTYRFL